MLIPLLLIILAALAAGVVAYGTHPAWGQFDQGLQFIVWSRRLQWPLVTLSLMLCLVLIALVILGKKRAWWLIGLGPILALFVHHFAGFARDRAGALAVLEDPPIVDAIAARGISDDDWVVGVSFAGGEYAYPYAALFRAPVVIQTDRDSRMVVLWSAYANHVLAFRATNAIKARDLEVVSTPANAPLIYDSRRGQFINGLKGLTLDGRAPSGFGQPLRTTKTTWRQWRFAHTDGKVMVWSGGNRADPPAPTRPILPAWRMPGGHGDTPSSASTGPPRDGPPQPVEDQATPVKAPRVTVMGARKPLAIDISDVTAAPINVLAEGQQVLLFRPTADAAPRAFDARLPVDHPGVKTGNPPATLPAASPSGSGAEPALSWFVSLAHPLAAHPEAAYLEVTSNTVWTMEGSGIARTKSAGKHLQPLPVDDDVDWNVMKYWYPDLQLTVPARSPARQPVLPVKTRG